MESLILILFLICAGLPIALFGMIFALLTLLPPILRWNQSYAKIILTSIGLALFATLAFQPLSAYVNVKFTIYMSRIMTSSKMVDDLLNGSKADVEKELFIRAIRPRLEPQPCYSGQATICKIANEIEINAGEGAVPSKQSMEIYGWSIGFDLLWAWLGCLLTVLLVTIKNLRKRLTQAHPVV